MTIPLPGRGTRLQGVLALADISGYTAFLQGVQESHPGPAAGLLPLTETYDDLPPIPTRVLALA